MAEVLIAAGVSRSFQVGEDTVYAVRSASFRIVDAEVVAVLGRSGAGTSALLAMCAGLDRPDQGAISVAGRDLRELTGGSREAFLRRTVGWVGQRPMLLPLLTVEENVALAGRMAGESQEGGRQLALLALDALGLRERAGRLGGELSASEQRRAALARALIKDPALLVVDQPTAHLDAQATATVLALLREAADSGTSVLMATQDETVAAAADRVLVMEAGTVRET